ncbi:MAG: hypothetical protein JO022_05535 [Acidobacteriaceae bacterium]|nr:hypothetical protein [Acidobacteriaceae bacterium]
MSETEKQDGLTPLELELLSALEKANWFIHDMTGDGHRDFRDKTLMPAIEKARRIHAEAEVRKWKTVK